MTRVPLDGGLTAAMRAKDPELYQRIAPMAIIDGVDEWRKTYPEDIWDLSLPPGAYLIRRTVLPAPTPPE